MSRGARDHILTAAMFTDIIGSTELAAEMGDVAWKRLLQAHHQIVRRLVRRQDGRIVDTAGDGVFAIFERPAAAVSCAFEAVSALREIGIEIRAGIHFGEGESLGRKVSGIGVHTASRVMALAGPGEVLITRTVRDLVGGRRIVSIDRGSHVLKGIPGSWEVFAVQEVDGKRTAPPVDPAEAAERRGTLARRRVSPRRGRVVAGLSAVIAIVLVSIALIRDGEHDVAESTPQRNLVRLDPTTDEQVRIPVGDALTSVATGEGSVWVVSNTERRVYRVDPSTSQVSGHVDLDERPNEVTVGEGSVWVTTSTELLRIDPVSKKVVHRSPIGSCPEDLACTTDVAVAAGFVWAVHYDSQRLIKFDPARNDEIRRFALEAPPITLAAGGDAVWVLLDGLVPKVVRVDVASEVTSSQPLPGGTAIANCLNRDVGPAFAAELCGAIAVGERAAWVATTGQFSSELWQLDPTTGRRVEDPRSIGCCVMAMFPSAGLIDELWIGLSAGDLAVVPEVFSDQQKQIPVGGTITDVTVGYEGVWVTVHDPR